MNWDDLVRKHIGTTWDVVIEATDDLSCAQVAQLEDGGYYGYPVREEDLPRLEAGLPRETSQFSVIYRGVDGVGEQAFDNAESALEYVYSCAQWWTGPQSAHSDYAHWDCVGFEYPDWHRHTP